MLSRSLTLYITLILSFFLHQNLYAQTDISVQTGYVVKIQASLTDAEKLMLDQWIVDQHLKKESQKGAFIFDLALTSQAQSIDSASFLRTWKSVFGDRIILEPNHTFDISDNVSDTYNENQWALTDASTVKLNLEPVWAMHTGNKEMVIGIIDTGIDYGHEDLHENIWQNLAEDADGDGRTLELINGRWELDPGDLDGVDADGNGYVDDLIGWDFVENDNNPFDDNGHGTHVSGVIGAKGNNNTGITGVNWDIQMMALKAFDAHGSGTTASTLAAMEYARTMGARLTNNSWGGPNYSQLLHDEILAQESANMLCVAAAGNASQDIKKTPTYPAAYDVDNIISVAAIDSTHALASFSNHSHKHVDLAAPGVSIFSTMPDDSYQYMSGTSMAAPYVAGVAALIWSYNTGSDAGEVKTSILENVHFNTKLKQTCATSGHLNAFDAFFASTYPCENLSKVFKNFEVNDIEMEGQDVWMATDRGLIAMSQNTCDYTLYTRNNSILPDNEVNRVVIGNSGKVYVGTSEGLVVIDGTSWTLLGANQIGLSNNNLNISALAVDENETVWIGTRTGELGKYENGSWTIFNGQNSPLGHYGILDIAVSLTGNIWMGTNGGGVVGYVNGAWTDFNHNYSNHGSGNYVRTYAYAPPYLRSSVVQSITFDLNGMMWIGTKEGFVYWTGGQSIAYYSRNIGIPNDDVRDIYFDKNDAIWIATAYGAVRYNGYGWTHYHTGNSDLPSNSTNVIISDPLNHIWVGTRSGAHAINYKIIAKFHLPEAVCLNQAFEVNNETVGATSYRWVVDGQYAGEDEELDWTFVTPGVHDIVLYANNGTLSDSFATSFEVKEPITLDLGNDMTLCAPAVRLDAGVEDVAYAWYDEQGNLLETKRHLIVRSSGTYTLEVTDACAGVLTDQINIQLTQGCVWPGDVNTDGSVNMLDYLSLSVAEGARGSARADQGKEWRSYQAPDWAQSFSANNDLAPNVNFKHADCDGDGKVEQLGDGYIISRNAIYPHSSLGIEDSLGFFLKVEKIKSVPLYGSLVYLEYDVVLCANDSNLMNQAFGAAFRWEMSHELSSPPFLLPGNGWAALKSSTISYTASQSRSNALNQGFFQAQSADMAVADLDQVANRVGTTGGNDQHGQSSISSIMNMALEKIAVRAGIIVTIDDISGDSLLINHSIFSLQAVDLVVIDDQGQVLPNLNTTSSQNVHYTNMRDVQEVSDTEETVQTAEENTLDIRLAPNPAYETVTLRLSESLETEADLEILTLSGQRVYHERLSAGYPVRQVKVDGLAPGIYVLRVRHAKGQAVKRLSILRR